jgi:hypothetical protein
MHMSCWFLPFLSLETLRCFLHMRNMFCSRVQMSLLERMIWEKVCVISLEISSVLKAINQDEGNRLACTEWQTPMHSKKKRVLRNWTFTYTERLVKIGTSLQCSSKIGFKEWRPGYLKYICIHKINVSLPLR